MRKPVFFVVISVAAGGYVGWMSLASSMGRVARLRERQPQMGWATCNLNAGRMNASTFKPLSDTSAAALVTHEPEDRRYNGRSYSLDSTRYPPTNAYVATARELKLFWRSTIKGGESILRFNPYLRYVDGLDGLHSPSTDDLIQWTAHKWGIPEDWLRAQYVQESYWNAFQEGDEATVGSDWYLRYPLQARVRDARSVFQSLGVTQVKWLPDGSVGPGSEPLRWKSTAFNMDYQAATVRFYYDDPAGRRSAWGDPSYTPCQPWNSVGGWFEPYPWGNRAQAQYIAKVRRHLRDREWTTASFVDWTPSAFPRGISFRGSGARNASGAPASTVS